MINGRNNSSPAVYSTAVMQMIASRMEASMRKEKRSRARMLLTKSTSEKKYNGKNNEHMRIDNRYPLLFESWEDQHQQSDQLDLVLFLQTRDS